ncbi:hypothetical protein DPMN_131805 [Dreissena polymorpha]|uniref:Uncharacterized protein n=1 Tax=Dreissena polymorpha TaxID=45954 RepID=A0A9D4JD57_DREPO|nr:hypothetical protein DPMN_131805 [Dreissena polymorpha]
MCSRTVKDAHGQPRHTWLSPDSIRQLHGPSRNIRDAGIVTNRHRSYEPPIPEHQGLSGTFKDLQ